MSGCSLLAVAATVTSAAAIGFYTHADKRADHWRPIFEEIAKRSGADGVHNVRVLPLKGCGWSLGETVYGQMRLGGADSAFTMCRSRQGVRFDIMTFESRWIRGRA